MCGIVGMAGNLLYKDEATMKKMLVLDYFRGPDSTGLASIRRNGEVKIFKDTTDPISCFFNKKFDDTLDGPKSRVFIGHNRYATTGGVNRANAHPFEVDHIIGAHNGTLDTASWTRLEKALGEEFNVDSLALITAIARLGIKEAIGLCTKGATSSTGAWSLVWYDMFEGTLNFLRNEHRPMWLGYEKGFKHIFFASQWPMIDAALQTSDMAYEIYADEKGFRYFPTDVDMHYKFDIGLFMMGSDKPVKPKVQKIEGREPEPVKTTSFPTKPHGTVCGFHNPNTTQTSANDTKSSKTLSRGKTQRSPDKVLHWLGTEKHPLAGYINEERFSEMLVGTKGCCYWCNEKVEFAEPGLTIYERDGIILCGTCSGHPEPKDETPCRIYVSAGNFDALQR